MKRYLLAFVILAGIGVACKGSALGNCAWNGDLQHIGVPCATNTTMQIMMGQTTAADIAANNSVASGILAQTTTATHPFIILTGEDPPYPGLDGNGNPEMCNGGTQLTCDATIATWHPVYVIRWSHYDTYNTTPNFSLCPTASPPAPTPVPGSTPTPGPAGSDTGICPDITGQNSGGTVPSYVTYAMYDNELETSQGTPIWESNAPAFYYPLAAAVAHANGLKFIATGGLHLTLSTTPGYAAYPCYTGGPPCTADAANDTWEAIGCGVVTQNSGAACPTAVPSSQSDGQAMQSQTGIGPGQPPSVSLTSFLSVIHNDQSALGTVCGSGKCASSFQYSAGTGTLGNCDTCTTGKGLLTQGQMDAGAQNIARGTIVWWNIGPHSGPSLQSDQNFTVVQSTCVFTTAGSGGIPGSDCMGWNEIINLQYFQPPVTQP